jgi:hypothetical protein
MKKIVRLTESDLVRLVKKIQEASGDAEMANNQANGRQFDKMVIDCLTKDGFKQINSPNSNVYMEKILGKVNVDGKVAVKKLVVSSSQRDPNLFQMAMMIHEGELGYGKIKVGVTTTCNDIVKFANNPTNWKGDPSKYPVIKK